MILLMVGDPFSNLAPFFFFENLLQSYMPFAMFNNSKFFFQCILNFYLWK